MNFFKENWFKLGIILVGFLWVFFTVIYPRYVGARCYESARETILNSKDTSDLLGKFNGIYELCRDKMGY